MPEGNRTRYIYSRPTWSFYWNVFWTNILGNIFWNCTWFGSATKFHGFVMEFWSCLFHLLTYLFWLTKKRSWSLPLKYSNELLSNSWTPFIIADNLHTNSFYALLWKSNCFIFKLNVSTGNATTLSYFQKLLFRLYFCKYITDMYTH